MLHVHVCECLHSINICVNMHGYNMEYTIINFKYLHSGYNILLYIVLESFKLNQSINIPTILLLQYCN